MNFSESRKLGHTITVKRREDGVAGDARAMGVRIWKGVKMGRVDLRRRLVEARCIKPL